MTGPTPGWASSTGAMAYQPSELRASALACGGRQGPLGGQPQRPDGGAVLERAGAAPSPAQPAPGRRSLGPQPGPQRLGGGDHQRLELGHTSARPRRAGASSTRRASRSPAPRAAGLLTASASRPARMASKGRSWRRRPAAGWAGRPRPPTRHGRPRSRPAQRHSSPHPPPPSSAGPVPVRGQRQQRLVAGRVGGHHQLPDQATVGGSRRRRESRWVSTPMTCRPSQPVRHAVSLLPTATGHAGLGGHRTADCDGSQPSGWTGC